MYARLLLPVPLGGEFTYSIPEKLAGEVKFGRRVTAPFGRRKVTGFVVGLDEKAPEGFAIRDIISVLDKDTEVFTPELLELARFISRMYLCPAGLALSAMVPSGKRETGNPFVLSAESDFTPIAHLAGQQEKALAAIRSGRGLYYLYGVTGSGKSEVYLRAAEDVIKNGNQVIYLVPEITLTHQLNEDVTARFKGRVALLHSALTPSMRLKEWKRIIRGEVDLVIGARSAVFAPCPNLGLIIMDEEHESSYKSGQAPRYHARQVAQKRAEMNGISFVMGSATPSLEAWNMMERGLVKKLELPNRVAGGVRPSVEVVPMGGVDRCISPRLESEMRRTLLSGRSVILFLNRRGHSHCYHCRTCGHVFECPHCSVAMTMHRATGRLHCHYCGWSEPLPDHCPECSSTDITVAGFGTEKIEEEVRALFPGKNIARLDTDVASGDRKVVKGIIDGFRDGEIDILLGTQMVAKGLNFPLLSLVGVVNADSALSVPDFRSEERAYSLLEQVAGRSGRYDSSGKVVIQTFRPADRAITAVERNEGPAFYAAEMEARRALSYPPFSRMVQCVCRSYDGKKAEESAKSFASAVMEAAASLGLSSAVGLLGVAPCAIEKKANSWRHQALFSGPSVTALTRSVARALEVWKAPGGVHLEIDVDPVSLM